MPTTVRVVVRLDGKCSMMFHFFPFNRVVKCFFELTHHSYYVATPLYLGYIDVQAVFPYVGEGLVFQRFDEVVQF